MRLARNFFSKNADVVARSLLGKVIIRREGIKVWGGKIVEVEAYMGTKDKAAHSYNGRKTKRTEVMFAGGGFVYMFLVYGMHWQLNFTCGTKGLGQAVLIRALEPAATLGFGDIKKSYSDRPKQGPSLLLAERMKLVKVASGPGKVCRFLKLDKSFYGEDVTTSGRIRVENREISAKKKDIAIVPRVGINYAGKWKDAPLRFYLLNSLAVSGR